MGLGVVVMRVDKGLDYGCVRDWTLGWIQGSVGWGYEEGGSVIVNQ